MQQNSGKPLVSKMDNLYCYISDHRPERWENVPPASEEIPGIWGHLMTFIGGTRACIGYHFTIVE